jgi:hypothetical protein
MYMDQDKTLEDTMQFFKERGLDWRYVIVPELKRGIRSQTAANAIGKSSSRNGSSRRMSLPKR